MTNQPSLLIKLYRLAGSLALAIGLMLFSAVIVRAMGGTISGTVTAPGGFPLPAGTVVKLVEPGSEAVKGQASPDVNDGSFSLGPVSSGVYILKAVPPVSSGLTQSLPQPVSIINSNVSGVTLLLTTPQITGTVVKPDGVTPVTATVKVLVGNHLTFQSVAAPGGDFAIGGLPDGSYHVQAFPAVDEPLWQSARQPVTIDNSVQPPLTLTLTAAQLWGTAVDALDQPVQNARVAATGQANLLRHRSDTTSGSGFWAIGDLDPGTYGVTARPPFDQPELISPQPFSVTLPAGATNPYTLTFGFSQKIVNGQVTTNGGDPVEQARVLARRVDKQAQASALTGADGSYQLRLAPGLWALTVRKTDSTNPADWIYPRPPQLIFFKFNDQAETKIQNFEVITADARVSGQVELPGGGDPPDTVTVALRNSEGLGQRTHIPPNMGAFSLNVPHGSYKVILHPHDPGYLGPNLDPIQLAPNSNTDLGTLTLVEKSAAITGTVKDDQGDGVEGLPVTAWRVGTPDTVSTLTGPDGRYVLPLTPGRWRVRPAPGPMHPYLYQGLGTGVTLTNGQVVPDIDFEVVTANSLIEGQLVDEAGDAVSGVDGWARAIDSGAPPVFNGAPIEDGQFSIYVPAGTYTVRAYLPAGSGYTSGSTPGVTVAAGETVSMTVTVQEKDATINGTLWDARNDEVVSGVNGLVGAWSAGNWAATQIDAGNGSYSLGVTAGLWNLGYRIDPTAGFAKAAAYKTVPVQSGQTAVVPLPVLPKDGTIAGSVLDPDGNPLGGVVVKAKGTAPDLAEVILKTLSRADGSFTLAVPHGSYRLGALGGAANGWLKPAEKDVTVQAGQTSTGHQLQFRMPDAAISGTLTISTAGLNGEALVWAWAEDGGFTAGRFPITNSGGTYSLAVISGTTWTVGAIFETDADYWNVREEISLNSGSGTLDLTLTGPNPKPAPVVVTFDAAEPQQIDLADGTRLFIPGGAMPVTGQVTLRIVPIATLPYQQQANIYKYGYAFIATDESGALIEENFNQDVVITFGYQEAELAQLGIIESQLKPVYFSTTTQHWTLPESYAVDTANNLVTMQIDHFTDFALAAAADGDQTVYLPLIRK